MHRPRILTLGLIVALIASAVFVFYSLRAPDAADLASAAEAADALLPSSEFLNAAEAVSFYEAALRTDSDNVAYLTALAQAHLQLARTGDETTHVPAAEAALADALDRDPDNVHARLLQGVVLNKLHRFEDARDLATELLAQHPSLADAHAILIDALVELGEYDDAVTASDAMQATRPGLPAYARVAYLRELHGDSEGALAAMRLAVDAGAAGTDERAWAVTELAALYLGEANTSAARYLYSGVLDERPAYAPAVAGLGHVALVEGDAEEAIDYLEQAYRLTPSDGFLELLADAYEAAGDTDAADRTRERVLDGLADARAMGEIVDMEEADYLLDLDRDVERALRMAQAQVERRPGHLHANETMAWALLKNGRAAEGIPYIEHALRLNTGDAMVHYRAARIYEAAGQPAEAQRHLQIALDGNLHIESGATAQEAQRLLAALSDPSSTGLSTPARAARLDG
ncbi:MAG: tetratricopeptide repeat protein [Bacteroidota bacterium]